MRGPIERQRQAINDNRDRALAAGVLVDGVRYHTDAVFLTELMGIVLGTQAGVYAPDAPHAIRGMDNSIQSLTVAQIVPIAAAVGAHRKAVYAASWQEKDAL